MKLYCKLKTKEDGTFENVIEEGPRELPQNSNRISNLNILDDISLKNLGWLPVERVQDNKPVIVSFLYEILEDKIIEKVITREKTQEEILLEKEKQNYYKWQEIRELRNSLLDETDKLVMIDRWEILSEEEKQKIKNYRKQLRDLPSKSSDPFLIEFPQL
jgi:hypothetical protein